jgi:hypothetical protein
MLEQSVVIQGTQVRIMRTQPICILFFALSSPGLILAQAPTPTGIQRNGVVDLLRAESKLSLIPGMPPIESTTDNVTGAFVSTDYTNYTPPMTALTTIGPCIIITTPLPVTPPTGPQPVQTFLDAGPVINVSGPNGAKQIPKMRNAYFLQVGGGVAIPTPIPIPGLPGVLPLYLDPGTYTVDNGGGGADVGPFSVTLNVPSPGFVWTNADANPTISLSAGVDLQWSGGDPNTNVLIQGVSTTPTLAGSFACNVPNTGEFMVTSDVLAMIPATPAGAQPTSSTLTLINQSSASFSASGLDLGMLLYQSGATRPVVYQ